MAGDRRVGLETSASRLALIDSVEAIIRENGYAALSARRVAERAGLKHQLVYYYFQSMDELLLAAYRRHTERIGERIRLALRTPKPLLALWQVWSDPNNARLNIEFLALANHNQAVREHTTAFGEKLRQIHDDAQTCPTARNWRVPGLAEHDPVTVTIAIGSLGTVVGLKSTLNPLGEHSEINALVEWCLGQLEASGYA
jgi:AcrR family transcriptional regulator